ncbi:MAG: universal stress protein [Anaerolineales bacterium]|nr:universal stress protein [Anaerolineales bacterium]
MYNTILVPLDGSQRAEAILPHVENLALCHSSKVVLLQVVEPKPLMIDGTNAVPDLVEYEHHLKEAQVYLTRWQSKFQEKGIEARIHLPEGGPVVTQIIHVAENENAELIAMASHGRTGLARVFYGSVAAGVLHRIDRPLLLIRSEDID